MAAQIPLGQMAAGADAVEYSSYAYATGTVYWELVGRDDTGTKRLFHIIAYPGTPQSSHNNSPTPSLFVDLTNNKAYFKTAASTFTVIGSVT